MASLAGTLPELQTAWDALKRYAASVGIGISVADFGGIRTQADTTRILDYRRADYQKALASGLIRADTTLQQFRPIAPFGASWHNYGAAFDVHVDSRPASMSYDGALAKLGAYAPSIGLRWGGRFTNPDPPHFELAIPLSEAQARYQAFASSGGASSSGMFGLNFDLSSLLPGLTPSAPSDDAIAATLAFPNISPSMLPADESGEIGLDNGPWDDGAPGLDAQTPLLVAGLVVAGVLVWILRRRYA